MNPPMDAPIDMVVNPLWQWIFGVLHFGVAGLTIYLVLRNPMRHRDWWKVLFRTVILGSGALGAVVFEGTVDRAGKLWYAEHGASFVMFGSMYVSHAFVTWPTVTALHSGASPLIAGLAARAVPQRATTRAL